MAEDARATARKRLREATNITLAIDESKYRKVVRFRCDTPGPDAVGNYVARGVLGILSCARESTEEFLEDHALVATRRLGVFLLRFCTCLDSKGQLA